MHSPLAMLLHEDDSARENARQALLKAGIDVVAVATPVEAADVLRARPDAVVVVMSEGAATVARAGQIATLCRLTAQERNSGVGEVHGRSPAVEALRHRLRELAASESPVLFEGEKGSGRSHAARSLHGLSGESGRFLVVPTGDAPALQAAWAETRGTVFVPSIEQATWSVQEEIAARLSAGTGSVRIMASTAVDPVKAADEGLLAPSLVAAFAQGSVRVPALRERLEDVAVLARAFVEELRLLNGLPPVAIAEDATTALEKYTWPGNVRQLRAAIESALTVAQDGTVRATDLPEYVRSALEPGGRADRRFRDAKRTVVEAFERAYLEDLLRRHGGNVTGAAEQSGMLRSALQRLLRKHDLHSADFRRRGGPNTFAS